MAYLTYLRVALDDNLFLVSQVTVEGFDPLLQFAYTAKLLFTKENVLEIRKCANILGFQNLDKACFDFLIPKFFDSSRSTPAAPRKVCCGRKSGCKKPPKRSSDGDFDDDGNDDDEVFEVKEESGDTECPVGKEDPKIVAPSAKLADEAPRSLGPGCPDVTKQTDLALRCPKYRKFQNACGKERSSSPQVPSASSSSSSVSPAAKGQASPVRHREEASGLAEGILGRCKSEADMVRENEAAVVAVCPPPALVTSPGNPNGGRFQEALDSRCSPSVGSVGVEPDCCTMGPCGTRFLAFATGGGEEVEGEEEEEEGGSNCKRLVELEPANPEFPSMLGEKGGGERSTIEKEVAEHLAKGFWSAYLDPPRESPMGPSSDHGWCKRLARTPRELECPFLQNKGLSQVENKSYDSSLNSGEDSDTEGASECSSFQRAPEVRASQRSVPFQEVTFHWWLFVCIAQMCGWFR